MSDQILDDEHDEQPPPPVGGRRRKRRGVKGCLAVLVALAVVIGGFYFVVTKGVDLLQSQFSSAKDFDGPGRGKLAFEVHKGDSVAEMGRNLKKAGVVASVEAFTDAAAANSDATKIQVGFYELRKEMHAADVVEVLVDPSNIVQSAVTIPEGLRVTEILDVLADKTDFPRAAFQKVLDNPDDLGLPDYAEGNADGYLFPATYAFGPKETPKTMLQTMVARWQQAADDADLEGAAADLGHTHAELMIVASLVEAEASRAQDRGKVARVIYNRLENPDNGLTNGKLQIDASVNYGLQQKLGVALTEDQLNQDTPYNTYTRAGLPPTPIEAPGDAAIAAAAHPTDGPWLYYVTVNLSTGETKFTDDYGEFTQYRSELHTYCESSDAC
jgi:UPF0755 protein